MPWFADLRPFLLGLCRAQVDNMSLDPQGGTDECRSTCSAHYSVVHIRPAVCLCPLFVCRLELCTLPDPLKRSWSPQITLLFKYKNVRCDIWCVARGVRATRGRSIGRLGLIFDETEVYRMYKILTFPKFPLPTPIIWPVTSPGYRSEPSRRCRTRWAARPPGR